MLKLSLFLDLEFWGVNKDSIPNVRKFIPTNIFIKGWIVYPYEKEVYI